MSQWLHLNILKGHDVHREGTLSLVLIRERKKDLVSGLKSVSLSNFTGKQVPCEVSPWLQGATSASMSWLTSIHRPQSGPELSKSIIRRNLVLLIVALFLLQAHPLMAL